MYTAAAFPAKACSTAAASITTPAPRFVAIVRPESELTSTRHWPVRQFDGAAAQDAPNTDRPEVALVLLTENVMADGPHERRVRAQGGETDGSVGGRSPGHQDPAAHELGDPRDLVRRR